MRLRKLLFAVPVLLLACAAAQPAAKDAPRSFSLSTSRTFAPGESVKIQLYAKNVPALEFRVYQVRDPEKFFAGLKDLHSFGVKSESPEEKIDERTFLERLHDFKAGLWWRVRHFFRGQFTDQARDSFREQQGKLGKRSKVVGATEFARIPLLNESQLVARWKLETPPAIVSETQQLPIDGLAAGVYLIEATDGAYKAYTLAIVTSIAVVERASGGQASLYVADRKTGAPIEKADVALWTGSHLQSSAKTGTDGMASLTMTVRGGAQGAEPENVWIIARHGADAALVTPWGYAFGPDRQTDLTAYVYTDRPVYRPGHTVHIKAVVRRQEDDALDLPEEKTLHLRVTGADGKQVLDKDLPVSAHGTVTADLALAGDAGLGYYSIGLLRNGQNAGEGSFYVEEYKKPEYQVTVKPTTPRVLQGNSIQATIEARYFFGEPVPGAKVKYVVHTSTHYWWDESDAEGGGDSGDSAESGDSEDSSGYGETEQQEHEGVLDANGRLAIAVPAPIDQKHFDQDYRIEARVTDAANREVSGHSTVLATYGSFRVSVEPVSYVFQGGQPVRVKVTAQDYDGKSVQTPVHIGATLEKWDSVTHQRTDTPVASRDAATGADGTTLVDLQITGSGSFQVTASAQTMSSFLPDLIVSQAIDKLHLKSPIDPATLRDMVNAGIERLAGFQHDDGGWGWWQDDPSRVFMTAYVVSGLGQAKAAGWKIGPDSLDKGRNWLLSTLAAHPDMVADLRAYVVYALATTGGAPKNALDKTWESRGKLSDEGLALAGLALEAAGDGRAKEAATVLEKKAKVTNADAYWTGNYDGLLEYWDDTSAETTAFALKLLVRQDRGSGLLPKAAQWLGKHRNGDYWDSTKQTAMVIGGLTDYLALSGELANTSDVEVLVNGASVGKRHFGPGESFAPPWRIKVSETQAGDGGQVTVRKSGNGITYWSAESAWYSADRRLFQQEKLALNITRDYYLLQKKQAQPTDPITYDLVPLKGAVHVGDIVAVKLAVNGTDWKYLLAEDPIPAGTEFLANTGLYKLNNKPSWWADWYTRKEFHDDRAAFFNTDFSNRREYVYLLKVVNPGKFVISPAQAGPMYQSNVQTTTDPATLEVQP